MRGETNWSKRVAALMDGNFQRNRLNTKIPDHLRVSFPENLYQMIEQSVGSVKAFNICETLNEKAPLTVRVNPMKVSRDELFDQWKRFKKYHIKKTSYSPLGITFLNSPGESLYELNEYKKGYFEIQDEGSQLVGFQVDCKPGDLVLDFCAGAGGKALTFGPMLQNTGQIYFHDVRKNVIDQSKKRASRAGFGNCQFHVGQKSMKSMKKKFDWIIADVPCTGVGTIRRNPDLKYKIDGEWISHLVKLQKSIFDQAITYLKPGGKIVYATCSILDIENTNQIKKFVKEHNLEIENNQEFQSLPVSDGMDGFYACTLIKK